MKSRGKVIIICTVVIVIVLSVIGIMGIMTFQSLNIRFFEDIESFSKLDEYVVRELELADDKYLGNLSVTSYYAKEISYNGEKYSVFAYVFSNNEASFEYFKKCTGKKTDLDWNYSSSSNFTSSRYLAYYGNCLYRIEGGSIRAFVEAVNFINETFPIGYDELKSKQTE